MKDKKRSAALAPDESSSRRQFLKTLGIAGTAAATAPAALAETASPLPQYLNLVRSHSSTAANDKVRIALVGTGGMGIGDTQTALMVDGVEMVAACDLYDGRLRRARELWGEQLPVTKDYREILERKDVDAIINGTTDHWHEKISTDAMHKGKHVYCEKPMVQKFEDGHKLIKVAKETGKVFQVGSQFASSLLIAKARELMKAGDIGELVFAEAIYDRHSAMGAWQYSIPPDASPQTVDWDTYLGSAPKRPWDPLRFFRWRNYQDYGTGIAGDLYVHLLTSLHCITGSKGPNRVYSTGGTRYWKDGRDVPDIQLSIYDYAKTAELPEFNLTTRSTLKMVAVATTWSGLWVPKVTYRWVLIASLFTVINFRRHRVCRLTISLKTRKSCTSPSTINSTRKRPNWSVRKSLNTHFLKSTKATATSISLISSTRSGRVPRT